MHPIKLTIVLLAVCACLEVRSENALPPITVSIAIPVEGSILGHESRSLSFRIPGAHFHPIISNVSTNDIHLWKEDCSLGYETLSFEVADDAGNRWTAKKTHRNWRTNYPRWWVLKPKESLVIDVYFGDAGIWEGFRRPPKGKPLTVIVRAVFEIPADKDAKDHQVWTGRVVASPVQLQFHE
jgi:hypothetical protein